MGSPQMEQCAWPSVEALLAGVIAMESPDDVDRVLTKLTEGK
jgi:hypothetical protein